MFDLGQETENLLQWIANFAKDPNGGVTRFLYSPEWIRTQKELEKFMKNEGFEVYYDHVGNLYGKLEGTQYKDETILTGSHIDTVKNGGIYDGQYGIVAGIIALKYLREKYGQPLRNIEVVSMAEEEGSRFPFVYWGSKNIFGMAKKEDIKGIVDAEGISFEDAMKQAGFGFEDKVVTTRKDIKAFLETHIEQGGVLEVEQKSVGVVQGIVGQRRFNIEITGESNHAGTTPMSYRKDAVYVTSKIVEMIIKMAKTYGDPLVATVGRMDVQPNISNVVPGKVSFSLDVRHIDKDILVKFTDEAISNMKGIVSKAGLEIHIDMWMDAAPVYMDPAVVDIVKGQCDKIGLNYKMMHSGAGHDSQIMARFVPTAMLFVPSHKGISHSPLEYTDPKDLGEGVKALIGAIYELAYKE